MNYLAHAYLSFRQPPILVGNLISDFVKGKKKFDYPPAVQNGINLHRMIDEYTDSHDSTRNIKEIFKPIYGLYGNAFADIVYDHFLANDSNQFDKQSLFEFSQQAYLMLDQYTDIFPERFAAMYPYMKKQNWLYNYRLSEGISNSFEGLVRRARYMNDSKPAFKLFEEHYDELRKQYAIFFPSIKVYAQECLIKLTQ